MKYIGGITIQWDSRPMKILRNSGNSSIKSSQDGKRSHKSTGSRNSASLQSNGQDSTAPKEFDDAEDYMERKDRYLHKVLLSNYPHKEIYVTISQIWNVQNPLR